MYFGHVPLSLYILNQAIIVHRDNLLDWQEHALDRRVAVLCKQIWTSSYEGLFNISGREGYSRNRSAAWSVGLVRPVTARERPDLDCNEG